MGKKGRFATYESGVKPPHSKVAPSNHGTFGKEVSGKSDT